MIEFDSFFFLLITSKILNIDVVDTIAIGEWTLSLYGMLWDKHTINEHIRLLCTYVQKLIRIKIVVHFYWFFICMSFTYSWDSGFRFGILSVQCLVLCVLIIIMFRWHFKVLYIFSVHSSHKTYKLYLTVSLSQQFLNAFILFFYIFVELAVMFRNYIVKWNKKARWKTIIWCLLVLLLLFCETYHCMRFEIFSIPCYPRRTVKNVRSFIGSWKNDPLSLILMNKKMVCVTIELTLISVCLYQHE